MTPTIPSFLKSSVAIAEKLEGMFKLVNSHGAPLELLFLPREKSEIFYLRQIVLIC